MSDSERHSVVRYPDGYAVIDKRDSNKIVFSTATKTTAHREAKRLNRVAS